MATAHSIVEEESMCSVCDEIHRDLHILQECHHIFCLKCIKEFEETGRVQCEDCRANAEVDEGKKNFKVQRIIDLHKELNKEDPNLKSRQCEMCEESGNMITSFCEDCGFICSTCSKLHSKMITLESHKLESASQVLEDYDSKIHGNIKELKQSLVDVDSQLAKVASDLSDVQQTNSKQIGDVRKFTEEIINDAKDNEKRLEKLVNDGNNEVIKCIHERDCKLQKYKEEMLSKISHLEDLTKKPVTQDYLKSGIETITSDVEKVRALVSSDKLYNVQSPVSVMKGEKPDMQGAIKVTVSDLKYNNGYLQPVTRGIYSELWTKTFQECQRIELDFSPRKLMCVNDQLWCMDVQETLHIYDKDCRLIKTIKLENPKAYSVRNVTVTDTGHIIVACSRNCGLLEFHPNGQYNTQIIEGFFSDVTMFNESLYAVEYHNKKLIVFAKDGNKWSKVQENCLQNIGHPSDRLCIGSKNIHFSSSKGFNIHVYNTKAEFMEKVDGFNGPLICGIDDDDNVLVADRRNHRLLVCDGTTSKWHVVTLPTDLNLPIDVVVGNLGELWIVQSSKTFVKFTT